jgi:serine/threonine protein kinase
MEFLPGETLAARIKRTGPVAEKEARAIAAQACAGLAQAHRQGVVHGDLKSSNIMLSESAEGGSRAVRGGSAPVRPAAGMARSNGPASSYDEEQEPMDPPPAHGGQEDDIPF